MEFTFCMIVALLMIYGMAMVFRWTGMDLAGRRIVYENSLFADVDPSYGICIRFDLLTGDCLEWSSEGKEEGPLKQLESSFYTPAKMNAVWSEE